MQRVHDAMHDIADHCAPQTGATARPELAHDAQVIVAFAQRYPNATFPVDDETGRTLSLLLATRQDLGRCEPEAAARVDQALPPQFRAAPSAGLPERR
ncbi:hypothetical protein GCM10009665_06840 [Kitasatospora nipponensis]|uniref:Uncharacterized protein n=1 Tax=Kitasatospora nipponensis TaxID=258049 RepID=A0ABP4GBD8_9ACTN